MDETKSIQKKLTISFIIGILLLALGIAMIVVGMVVNFNMKNAFVKTEDVPKYIPAWYIYLLEIGGAVLFLAASGELYFYIQNKFHTKKMNVKQMTVIAIFSGLSVILYYFAKFNLPFFPSWLDIQFSDVPALLVTFMYGPASGCILVLVRFFCKLPGTSTVGVGEFADVLIGVTLCIVSGLIYKKHKTFKGALCAMAFGMLAGTAVAAVANWLILIPAYVNLAGFPWAALVGSMNSYMGGVVTQDNFMLYYLFVGVVPFNLFRYVLIFIITLILYKRLHMLIAKITDEETPVKPEDVVIDNTSDELDA